MNGNVCCSHLTRYVSSIIHEYFFSFVALAAALIRMSNVVHKLMQIASHVAHIGAINMLCIVVVVVTATCN